MSTITLQTAGMSGTWYDYHTPAASYAEAVRVARTINRDGFDVRILVDGRVRTDTSVGGAPFYVVTYLDNSDSLYPVSLAQVNRTERTARRSGNGYIYGISRAQAATAIRAARRRGAKICIGLWMMDGPGITFGHPIFRRTERRAAALATA